jgi:hypothetical protein
MSPRGFPCFSDALLRPEFSHSPISCGGDSKALFIFYHASAPRLSRSGADGEELEGWTTSGGDENMREGEASKGRWPRR